MRAALAERLTAAAAAKGTEADAWGDSGPSAGLPLPDRLPRLAAELAALTAGIASVQALQARGLAGHTARLKPGRICLQSVSCQMAQPV